MKKIVTILLTLAIVLGLCACTGSNEGGNASGGTEGLQVGFGRASITPDFSVPLGGYSDMETRKSEGLVDYIYATCLAFTEGEETILLFTLDLGAANQGIKDDTRNAVSVATGISEDKIFIGATHTHSAPSFSLANDAATTKYRDFYNGAVAQAAKDALADRAAATISTTTTELENMNFVRHYLLENGTYAGSNFGDFATSPIKEHATETDPRMVLVKFDRADESKQDIMLMNWQAHPARATENGYNNISADFVGAARTKFEGETGMHFAYFTGASGNQNPESKIDSEMHNLNVKEYGEKLAEHAITAMANMTAVEGSGIKTSRVNFEAEIDHSWDDKLNQANEVYDLWKATSLATGNAKAKEYGFTSVYQARAIKSRAAMAATGNLELNAIRIGGVGFITGTYEMFSDAGIYVRANSPFETTVICTGNSGYIPSKEAYDYRSYESDTGYYAQGTAEKLAEKYVEMLNSVQ